MLRSPYSVRTSIVLLGLRTNMWLVYYDTLAIDSIQGKTIRNRRERSRSIIKTTTFCATYNVSAVNSLSRFWQLNPRFPQCTIICNHRHNLKPSKNTLLQYILATCVERSFTKAFVISSSSSDSINLRYTLS